MGYFKVHKNGIKLLLKIYNQEDLPRLIFIPLNTSKGLIIIIYVDYFYILSISYLKIQKILQ